MRKAYLATIAVVLATMPAQAASRNDNSDIWGNRSADHRMVAGMGFGDFLEDETPPPFLKRYRKIMLREPICVFKNGDMGLCFDESSKPARKPKHKRRNKHVPDYEDEADPITGGVPCAGFVSNRGGHNKSHLKAIRKLFKR